MNDKHGFWKALLAEGTCVRAQQPEQGASHLLSGLAGVQEWKPAVFLSCGVNAPTSAQHWPLHVVSRAVFVSLGVFSLGVYPHSSVARAPGWKRRCSLAPPRGPGNKPPAPTLAHLDAALFCSRRTGFSPRGLLRGRGLGLCEEGACCPIVRGFSPRARSTC